MLVGSEGRGPKLRLPNDLHRKDLRVGSLFQLLASIRTRPGMYLGPEERNRGRQLENLELLIWGYRAAVDGHGIADVGARALTDFPEYLRGRFGWSVACGAVAAIRDSCASEDEAWSRFWELLDEYRSHTFSR